VKRQINSTTVAVAGTELGVMTREKKAERDVASPSNEHYFGISMVRN
jgi:hypothetical protein